MAAYLEHVAYLVDDLAWHLQFFQEVYDMTPYREVVHEDGTRDIWLEGGIQLRSVIGKAPETGKCHHLCLIVDDLEAARTRALALGCTEMPKHHWVCTPEGTRVEMFTAAPGAVEALRKLPKKA